jgi:hypothetical protein
MPKAKSFHLAANYSRFAMRASHHPSFGRKKAAAIKVQPYGSGAVWS